MKSSKQGPALPLTDIEILSSASGSLIALWTIREYGQINFAGLFDALCVDHQPHSTENNKGTTQSGFARATRLLGGAVTRLAQAGLIEMTNGDVNDIEKARNAGEITEMMSLRERIMFRVTP